MNTRRRLPSPALSLACCALLFVLTGCFLVGHQHITYGVRLWYYAPGLDYEPFCYGVDLKATFGVNVLLDVHVDQSDLSDTPAAQEWSAAPQQRYYSGMPLTVKTVCTDDGGEEIGRSTYEGKLMSPNGPANFALINYPDPEVDFSTCVPPTESTGVQMCALAHGFKF